MLANRSYIGEYFEWAQMFAVLILRFELCLVMRIFAIILNIADVNLLYSYRNGEFGHFYICNIAKIFAV